MSRLAFAALALALAPLAAAQPEARFDLGAACALYDSPDGAVAGPAHDLGIDTARLGRTYDRVVSRRAATITVDYSTNFTVPARIAFQRAVDIWADHINSPIEIRIKADFEPLGTNTLGQAGPLIVRGFSAQALPNTWYPFALADAIGRRDFFPDAGDFFYDITATFNSSFSRFYFGTDGNPSSNQIDFVTVVLHELGHGLGFTGSGDVKDSETGNRCTGANGTGCWGFTSNNITSPIIFDRFLEDAAGNAFLDTEIYPNPSQALGNLLKSQELFVNSPTTFAVYGDRPPIWAPATFERGSSFSHWDEVVVARGSSAALMTPQLGNGEAYQDPGDITCAFFRDMGWELGSGCAMLTAPTAGEIGPGGADLAVRLTGPNPFRAATSFRVSRSAPGPLRVTVHDVLGRTVATLHHGDAPATLALRFDASSLAAGVYRVRTEADGAVLGTALTVVR